MNSIYGGEGSNDSNGRNNSSPYNSAHNNAGNSSNNNNIQNVAQRINVNDNHTIEIFNLLMQAMAQNGAGKFIIALYALYILLIFFFVQIKIQSTYKLLPSPPYLRHKWQ